MSTFFTDAMRAFKDKRDPFYLFDHFDTFFSIIEHASRIQIMLLMRVLDTLNHTSERSMRLLEAYLKQKDLDQQTAHLNLLKMLLYLMVSTVRAIDLIIMEESTDVLGSKKSAKKQTDRSHDIAYDDRRFEILKSIYDLLQLPLEQLWTMAIAEEDFVT